MRVVKEVNRIFYSNYSGSGMAVGLCEVLLRAVWVPIGVFVCLAVTLPFVSFECEEGVLMGLLGLIVGVLLGVSVHTFVRRPSSNNQIQQTQ